MTKRAFSINCGGRLLSTQKPLIMGILNVTPDSFYDGGRYYNSQDAVKARADEILEQGGDIIDIGAYSTRPGAEDVTPEEEWRRLSMALRIIKHDHPEAIISVDTFRGDIARRCITEGGAHIINDISAYTIDPEMLTAVVDLNVPYVLMHIKGVPQNMQNSPHYDGDVTDEVIAFLSAKIEELSSRGVSDIIVDPGFGFGKTVDDNYKMMADLRRFDVMNRPILVGTSRKSMIYKIIGGKPQDSLNGTTVLNTIALMAGADILRVHDVKECAEAIKIVERLKQNTD